MLILKNLNVLDQDDSEKKEKKYKKRATGKEEKEEEKDSYWMNVWKPRWKQENAENKSSCGTMSHTVNCEDSATCTYVSLLIREADGKIKIK